MNILILFSQPWRVGGAETHVEALISGFSTHNITLAINKGSDLKKVESLQKRYPNLQILQIQARGINILRWISDIWKLARYIKNEKIEIVSAQQRTAGIWAWLLYRFRGTPFVVTMHDPWHRTILRKIYSKIFPAMIVVSKNLADILIEKFAFCKQQITLINNGIDFSVFMPSDKQLMREELGLAQNSKIILHVSRLSSVKGAVALALIDSMEYLLQKDEKTKLIIIGEGPLRKKIAEKANLFNQKYAGSIEIKNFTDNIAAWYNGADVLVGEGRVAIETLACQRPVVAIRNGEYFFGAVTEQNIEQATAVNFDGKVLPVTTETLAAEIHKACNIKEEERAHIAQFICSRLSIASMAEKYLKLFVTLNKGNAYEKNTDY